MNTEGEVLDKDSKVLKGTSIEANIEFALGKDDITDMILEEHHEALETQLKATENEVKEIDKKFFELSDKHSEYLVSEFKKEFAKELRNAKKYFGEVKVNVNTSMYGVRINEPKTFTINTINRRDEYSNKPRRSVQHNHSVDGRQVYRCVLATAIDVKNPSNITYGTQANTKYSYEKAEWCLNRNYSDAEILDMPIVKQLITLDKTRQDLQGKAMQLEADLSNLETAGKRAKAKLVRSLLSASEQGRQLLAKMPNLNHKLALTDGNG